MRLCRHHLAAGLTAELVADCVAAPADAGWFGRNKKDAGREFTRMRPPRRIEIVTPLSFEAGRLALGVGGGWSLGTVPLLITDRTDIRRLDDPETAVSLMNGAEVYVMGKRSGGVLICREILVVPYLSLRAAPGAAAETILWSEADQTVGIVHGPQ